MSCSSRNARRATAFLTAVALLGPATLLNGCDESAASEAVQTNTAASADAALNAAILNGDDQAVYERIVAGVPVNTTNAIGDTPLHIAAALGREYAAEVLIGAGAELEVRNGSQVTPLFNAAFFCHADVLEVLIDAGADRNVTDQTGTPIVQIMETRWEQIRPIYEMVHTSIGLPFDEKRIESTRPTIAAMLR